MVVVSGSWVKKVATYPAPTANDDMVIPTEMCAKAVLICRPPSHPFQDRTLCLDQPIKVGRSVARARASTNNAIFDCKVLSRHHALLWYEKETGKFFLQDTKSSNGTFVNNNRLSSNHTTDSEAYEVSSGDIVQFGVDVVENNRKVTHGCIVAMLRLYLPDGKEAKASPSIMEGNRHGYVPIDELYKLNQIIQEAARREQSLESKLSSMQTFAEEAKRTSNLVWQVRVDEERLLSRVATLENQLAQAGKNWTDERLREEFNRLHEDKITYQEAAKNALQNLHNEKLQCAVAVTEQERARASAEAEVQIAEELLAQARSEIQVIAERLMEEQKHAEEERTQLEQKTRELEARLEEERQGNQELQTKLQQLMALHLNSGNNILQDGKEDLDVEKSNLIYNDVKLKEELLEENEDCDSDLNKSNGESEPEQNCINLSVAPVNQELPEENDVESVTSEASDNSEDSVRTLESAEDRHDREALHVTFKLPEDPNNHEVSDEESEQPETTEKTDADEKPFNSDQIDSKTLKYQYQSAQNELRKQVERLETTCNENKLRISDLEKELIAEKSANEDRIKLNEALKQELQNLQQKWKDSCNECQRLRDRVLQLTGELKATNENLKKAEEKAEKREGTNGVHTFEEVTALEEELVYLKERYVAITEEKQVLNKKLNALTAEYNSLCNRSYNQMFFYVAPLVLMVLYLLVSSITS